MEEWQSIIQDAPTHDIGRLVAAKSWIKRNPVAAFMGLAYALSWLIAMPLILTYWHIVPLDTNFALHYLVPFGSLLSALIISYVAGGRTGVREILGRMSKWGVRRVWIAVAVFSVWILYLSAGAISVLSGAPWPGLEIYGSVRYMPYLTVAGAWLFWVFTFGIGEETGWRGFLLPRLQSRFRALASAMIVSIIWAGWHTPMFLYNENFMAMGTVGTAFWVIGLMFGSTWLTWLYNSSKGSALMTALWHGTFNLFTGAAAQAASMTSGIITMFVMVWVLLIVVIYRPGNLSKSKRQTQTDIRHAQ